MAEIVLVHGIGQEQRNADVLEAEWLPSLAGGVRLGGFPELADRLWRYNQPGELETRMAFYGDLFVEHGQQGNGYGDLTEPQGLVTAETLAEEWLDRTVARASRADDRWTAEVELSSLRGQLDQQEGPRDRVRKFVNGAARIPWFARAGMEGARLAHRALGQVTRYLTEEHLHAQVQARVRKHLDDRTRVMIGHSLGAVVAFEASHQLTRPLPLLITLGNPLGLRTIVYDRVVPQPPTYPSRVRRWVNIADRDDIIAAEPDLTRLFGSSLPPDCRLDGCWTVDNGAKPHDPTFYLGKSLVGQLVADALASAS